MPDPTAISDSPPSRAPPAIHGARRPKRLRVRSDSAPAIGLASIAAIAPMALMTPSAVDLFSGSTWPTRSASSTAGTAP